MSINMSFLDENKFFNPSRVILATSNISECYICMYKCIRRYLPSSLVYLLNPKFVTNFDTTALCIIMFTIYYTVNLYGQPMCSITVFLVL